jgi:hypothetical protein
MLDDDAPGQRWAYPPVDMLLVSLFIGFHIATLLVYSMPSRGVMSGLNRLLNRYAEMSGYMGLVGNTPSWGMFAPDVARLNAFTRVLVEDRSGQAHDFLHDIHARRRYPYLFYDRMGKVNRRLIERPQQYRAPYAAWVCRDWERTHGGEPAHAVRLVTAWTRIPPPLQAYPTMGYEPRDLPLEQASPETFECASIPHGQLPPGLRARYGLPAAPADAFRDVFVRTWRVQKTGGPGTEEVLEEATDARARAMSADEGGVR